MLCMFTQYRAGFSVHSRLWEGERLLTLLLDLTCLMQVSGESLPFAQAYGMNLHSNQGCYETGKPFDFR